MWSRNCIPFRNARANTTCGVGTAYSFGTHELVPHVKQVLLILPNTGVSPTCGAGTAYPFGTHGLVPHVNQVLLILPEHTS